MHPHYYTLSILKHLLDKSENTLFSAERLLEMNKEYNKLMADPSASAQVIESTISAFGREIWPYHEALEELYFRHGKQKEEERVKEKLTPSTRQKYEQFLSSGGSLSDFRHGRDIEMYFTPEEKYEIGQAVLDARHTTMKEIASSCRADKKNECEEVIANHKQKLASIEQKLTVLKEMADASEKWRAEILDKVHTFEEAFGYLEKTFHEEDLNGAIDYYAGVIDLSESERP